MTLLYDHRGHSELVKSGDIGQHRADIYVQDGAFASSLSSLVDNVANGDYVNLVGFTTYGDGGEGQWRYDSTKARSEANLGTVLDTSVALNLTAQGTGSGNGCWLRSVYEVVTPEMWGADNTGATDCSAAIEAMGVFIQGAKGRPAGAFSRSGIYLIDAPVVFDGEHQLNLVGSFGDPRLNAAGDDIQSGYIKIGSNLTSSEFAFTVSPYNDIARHKAPTINFSGLVFADNLNVGESDPRGTSVGGALFIETADMSLIEDCSFYYIKGSAVKTERHIMSSMRNCVIRQCGDTAKPALWCKENIAAHATNLTQAYLIDGCKIESNYDEYVYLENSKAVKITNCSFEANNSDSTDLTAHDFITADSASERIAMQNNSFNKNGAKALSISAPNSVILGNTFGGNYDSNPVVELAAARITFQGNNGDSDSDQIGYFLTSIGSGCIISGNTLNNCGAISSTNYYTKITNNTFRQSFTQESYVISTTGDFDEISNNIISGNRNATTGGISATGQYTDVSHNTLDGVYAMGISAGGKHGSASHNILHNFTVMGLEILGSYASVIGNKFDDNAGSAGGIDASVGLNKTIDGNHLIDIGGTAITSPHATDIVRNNFGFVTEMSGGANINNPDTSAVVTHGMDVTPARIQVTQSGAGTGTAHSRIWTSSVGATQFTVNVDTTPGTSVSFQWYATRELV